MTVERTTPQNATAGRDRRFEVIVVLQFGVMLVGGLALFPFSVAANKLSGLWITLCASIGLG